MEKTYCFTNSRPGKSGFAAATSRWLPLLAMLMVLAGCAGTPQGSREGDASAAMDAQEAGDAGSHGQTGDAPADPDEVLYRVLAGEQHGNDGDLARAAEEYLAAALESDDPEVAQRATQVALAAQAWPYAAMAADRWVVLAPDSQEAIETAVRALLLAGDYVGAGHNLSLLLDLLVEDPLAGWNAVARLLSSARNPELTDRILKRLIADHDAAGNPFALFAQSQVAARSGDMTRAEVLAEMAADGAPDQPELHAWAGRVAISQGNQDLALEHYRMGWMIDPANRTFALLYAELLRQTGDAVLANEVLEGLPDTANNRFTRVAFALQSGQRERAEEIYAGFETTEYEDRQDLALHAARSAEMLEWPEEAIRWYEQVTEGEDRLLSLGRRAFIYSDLGRLADARRLLADARADGDAEVQVETLVLESQILIDAQQREAAFDILSEALQHRPADVRLMYTRALVAVELDRLALAERDLQQVIQREPQNAAALNALGYTLADRTDRYAEAEELILAAYRLSPEEPSIIDSMGWVAYRMGRLDEAVSFLRQAYSLERNAEIAAHLGEVLWVRGEKDDARTVWAEGRDVDPGNRVLEETLERFGVEL